MYLIDSHAHIYLNEFDADREAIVDHAQAAGVQQILMPAIDATTHDVMLAVEAEFPGCRAMMGLHPCSVKENYLEELEIIKNFLQQRQFVGIGEIGLDFYWDKTFVQQQFEAFHAQIRLALDNQLPIAIHSRNATDECIGVVRQYPGLRGVFHCFSGTTEQAEKIIALGFMLGIGGVVTFKNAGLDKVIEKVGLSHVILETDAPYLAPVPFRGKRNEPAYVPLVAQRLAQIAGVPAETVAEITSANTRKLFGL
jgi:TatD DNase family protein